MAFVAANQESKILAAKTVALAAARKDKQQPPIVYVRKGKK